MRLAFHRDRTALESFLRSTQTKPRTATEALAQFIQSERFAYVATLRLPTRSEQALQQAYLHARQRSRTVAQRLVHEAPECIVEPRLQRALGTPAYSDEECTRAYAELQKLTTEKHRVKDGSFQKQCEIVYDAMNTIVTKRPVKTAALTHFAKKTQLHVAEALRRLQEHLADALTYYPQALEARGKPLRKRDT